MINDFSEFTHHFYLTYKGYKLPLKLPDNINESNSQNQQKLTKLINDLKKELMVMPYTENPIRFPVFRISDKFIYIPKYFGINKFGIPDIKNIKEQEGQIVEFNFKGSLRDYQKDTCDLILNHIKEKQSGLASIYTGWGKTCAALWLISQMKRKSLIIVHTENLLNQWKERITDFLGIPVEEIGIIQGPKIDTKDKKIVIGMIQSISMKDYEPETFKEFGFTILDETHHTGSRIFSRIFYKIGTKYNLGLSATLTRTDGLTKVIKYFLGEVIVNLKLCTIIPNITIYYTGIEPLEEKRMVNGKANLPGMINDICDSFARNLEIINIIKNKYSEERKILVLTDRRNHCNVLQRLLNSCDNEKYTYSENTGVYYGGIKNDKLIEANKKRVIFATYQIASEGYDNPKLDTLIMATPKTNIEQAVGRILRQENKNKPEVIDIVDAWSVFNNLFFNRMKFYKRKKFNIKGDINKKIDNESQNIKLDKCFIVHD